MTFLASVLGGRSTLLLLRYEQIGVANLVSSDELQWQLAQLAIHRQPVALSDIALYLRGRCDLPRRGVALTFDVGDVRAIPSVANALERLALPATFFVTTGETDSSASWGWSALREYRCKLFEFGSRTVSGRPLGGRPPGEWCSELLESRRRMEQMLEAPCLAIAYPGEGDDHLPSLLAESGLAGYRLGVGRSSGMNPVGALEPFALRRVTVTPGMSRASFLAVLTNGRLDR